MGATTAVVAQEGIVRKTQFPRLVVPMSIVLTSFFNLGMNMVAVLVFALAFGVEPTWTWLLFPLSMLALIILTSSASSYLSALYVRHRDVGIIWSVAATALFYGSAVLYPIDDRPRGLAAGHHVRQPDRPDPGADEPVGDRSRRRRARSTRPAAGSSSCPAVAIFVGVCALSVWYFNREAPRVAEEL